MASRVVITLPNEVEYSMRIGQNVLNSLGEDLRAVESLAGRNQILVITDSHVGPLYAKQCQDRLNEAGYKTHLITIPEGETSKNIEVAHEVWRAMSQLGLDRNCIVLALGGGVVGDLAGFVASTYFRGVPLVNVPTSLIAMVDSSVGGKTAINLEEGKNLVGSFWQPSFISADTTLLQSLEDREWICGCAEIAKAAVLSNDDFFFWLCGVASRIKNRDDVAATEAIVRSVVTKADIVARDVDDDEDIRACLNYGHTLGHALETCLGYGKISHGAGIAEGMRFASWLAIEYANASQDFVNEQWRLLDMLDLKAASYEVNPSLILSVMKHDKKSKDNQIRFVLPYDIGSWKIVSLDEASVLERLTTWFSEKRSWS